MGMPKKYLFDVCFDRPEPKAEREIEEKFSRAEIEAARQAALAEGRSAGLAEAADAAAATAAAALDAMAKGVAVLLSTLDAKTVDMQRQAAAALRAIVAKALPALATKEPLAEIEAFAAKCLLEASEEPRIVLRVANEIYEPVQSRLAALSAASGYGGRIVLLADDHLSRGDARVEWADGGAERKLDERLGDIDALIARICDPAATPVPTSSEGDDV